MASQKDNKEQDELVKKLKAMIVSLQRAGALQELKNRRQAQEIRELKQENAYLKDRARKNG